MLFRKCWLGKIWFTWFKDLTVIDKTKRLKAKNIELDISKINQNDNKVFSLLSTGETTGLFQLESAGIESIKQMKPNKFDDTIALVALYRPGPMSNIPIYNDCKNGLKQPDYIHPTLRNFKPTYGIIIYQEQVMQIAQTLKGNCWWSGYDALWERKKGWIRQTKRDLLMGKKGILKM